MVYKNKNDWDVLTGDKKSEYMSDLINDLTDFITRLTDYICDPKIQFKDMAVVNEFMEPFKWNKITVYEKKLNNGAEILTTTLKSKDFWNKL